MSKVRYYFDPATLSYLPIKATNKNRVLNILLFTFSSFSFGVICLLILLNSDLINTPSEVAQKRTIQNYELQLEILNKKLSQLETVVANVEERDNNIYRVYFEASPIPEEQRYAGFGGVNRYRDLEGYDNSELIINTTKRLDILTKQTVVQSRSLDEIERLATNKSELIAAIPTIQPIKNKDLTRVASGFGYRIDPFTKKRRFHYGMDFTAKRGTPIYASGNGIVKRADNRSSGYGRHIRIDHGFGYISLYAHLSKYNVRRGQKVKRGEIIGYVGNTGRSAGPHLHYEILNKKLSQLETVVANVEERDNNIYRVYFEASPIPEEQRYAGFGGVNRYKDLEGYDNSELIINTTRRLDILTKQTVVQSRSLDEIESLATNKSELISAIPTIQPIKNKDLTRVASGFGYRIDPFTKKRRFHHGMDFTAKRGTPVYASGNGIVKRADNRSAGYGRHIRIDHGFGYVSLYAHLSKYNVRRGQKVKRGEIIGYVGNTGRSAGPHLHYEILKDKKKINPLNFYYGNLSPKEFEALLTQSKQENQSLD